jgi:hypothetical protein
VKGAIDGTESTRWSSGQPQAPGDYFQIDMGSDQIFNQITLDTGPNNAGDYPRWYEVYFSEDGSNWGTAYVSGPGTGQVATVDLPGTQRARFIRVVQTQSSGSWWSIAEFNVALVLTRSTWIATASPSSLGQDVYRALDGIPTTQWKSGGPQTGTGDYFQVDMRSAQKFSKIALDAGGNNTGEYPRSYAVYVSQDGTTWGGPVALGSGTGQITTASFATVSARFIRVVQTGSSAAWWSIAEFDVYP